MRSIFGGVFPLFATYMYEGMGIQWANTMLGAIAAVLIPMPIIFYLFGKRIRGKSKFAPAPDIMLDKKRDEEARIASAGDGESTDQDAAAAAKEKNVTNGTNGTNGNKKEE